MKDVIKIETVLHVDPDLEKPFMDADGLHVPPELEAVVTQDLHRFYEYFDRVLWILRAAEERS